MLQRKRNSGEESKLTKEIDKGTAMSKAAARASTLGVTRHAE
jgi:hypothetical protein